MDSFLANSHELAQDVHSCTDGEAMVSEPAQSCAETWLREMELIAQARDKEAFAKLFTFFGPRVKAYLLKSGLDDAQAEDCIQETFARVWLNAHRYNAERGAVSTWIFTIARNASVDAFRKIRNIDPYLFASDDEFVTEPPAEEIITHTQDVEQLKFAVQNLPDEQRDIIESAYFREMSHSEIAKKTGIPLGTIKSRLRLALRRLTGELN